MKRTWSMKRMGFGLVVVMAVALLAGPAWADPSGPADLPQIIGGETTGPGGARQRTLLTTDPIGFQAIYYDNAPGCAGFAPTFVHLFLFNLEGRFIQQFTAGSSALGPGSKYRALSHSFASVAAIPLTPGSYRFTFLVRSCDDAISVVVPEFVTFRVLAP